MEYSCSRRLAADAACRCPTGHGQRLFCARVILSMSFAGTRLETVESSRINAIDLPGNRRLPNWFFPSPTTPLWFLRSNREAGLISVDERKTRSFLLKRSGRSLIVRYQDRNPWLPAGERFSKWSFSATAGGIFFFLGTCCVKTLLNCKKFFIFLGDRHDF